MEKIEEALRIRVKKLRNDAGLSQVALATRAKVSVQTIKDIEAGRRGVGLKALEGISNALGVTIEDLRGEYEPVVEKVIKFKVSKMSKYIGSIPDDVYDLAVNIGPDHEIWEVVKGILETASEGVGKSTRTREQS